MWHIFLWRTRYGCFLCKEKRCWNCLVGNPQSVLDNLTSRKKEIESTKVRATELISGWRNAPIYSISKAHKKPEGERSYHLNNADWAVFPPTHPVSLNFLPIWAASPFLALLFPRAVNIWTAPFHHLFLTSLPFSAHREHNKLKGSGTQNSQREASLPSLKAQITCTK